MTKRITSTPKRQQPQIMGAVIIAGVVVVAATVGVFAPSMALAQSELRVSTSATVEARGDIAPPDNLPAVTDAVMDLSFNGSGNSGEAGYLYFKQDSEVAERPVVTWSADSVSTFTPRAAMTADADAYESMGSAWLRDSFTPRQADAHLSYSYAKTDEVSGETGAQFDVALSSSVRVDAMDMPGLVNNPTLSSAMNRQTYDIGLNLGYSGFNLGAAMRGGSSAFANVTSGYDVGFSYSGNSWSTSFLVGGYSRKYNNVFDDVVGDTTNFYALEFGASYRLNKALSVSGSFRYLTFDEAARLSLFDKSRSQVFYLGTSLNF